jgi:hypothetical protein
MEVCAIPGCESTGKHRLGLRCRVMTEPSPVAGKNKTDALWSVDTSAYLCDAHALGGLDSTLMIEASDAGTASIRVISGRETLPPRKVTIKTGH